MLPLLGLLSVLAAPLPRELAWEVVDVVSRRTYTMADDPSHLLNGGRFEARPEGAALDVTVDYQPPAVRVTLRDLSGRERGLVARLVLGLPPGEWQWWQDLDTTQPLGEGSLTNTVGLRELPGLPEFGEAERPDYGRYSPYPAGVVQGGDGWLALTRPLDQLALVRFAASGGSRPRLTAEVDLALSQQARNPGAGTFELRWYHGQEARGLRQAVGRVFGRQELRVTRWGGWMPFTDLAKIAHVDEFGFAYQEGAPNPSFDDALGADSFVYFHCAGEFANVQGYQRGTQP
ncbi:MAG: hypothetical protein HUU35_06975, partial [Armatimonadetes bacterium]|nr:hypothetical protein [Armatimonadota bacterium]